MSILRVSIFFCRQIRGNFVFYQIYFLQADVYKNDFLLEREEKNKLREEKNTLHGELENFKRLLYEVNMWAMFLFSSILHMNTK